MSTYREELYEDLRSKPGYAALYLAAAAADSPEALVIAKRDLVRAAAPELLEAVRNLRAWLEYWKGRTISQQSKDERGNVTNSWAACPIPDWDVKQKLQSLEELVAKAEGKQP